MQNGRERLRVWIERSRMTQQEAAKLLRFHETFLSQILRGRRRPGLKNAIRIERVTGIPVTAWAPIDSDDLDQRQSRDVDFSPVGRA